jgi:16S rRNA (guanine(966)-N(2))-methyltransferase RsmD
LDFSRVRIVAGKLGGRRLVAPKGMSTRPTADRVREALFSILFDVEDLRVLDLYAGTGAVGIEALSRGARSAVFVENARPAVLAIEKNLAALGLDRREAELWTMSAERALDRLAKERRELDLIFADPPYADADRALPAILVKAGALLSARGTIVLEHASTSLPPSAPPGFSLSRTKRYGETALAFYARSGDDAPEKPPMRLSNRTKAISPPATLTLAEKARELAQAGKDVVNLTTGEPDFPTPPHIVEAMKDALDRGLTKYTAVSGIPELKRAIVERYAELGIAYATDEVIVSTGAKQAVMGAILCLLQEGDEAIILAPYWLSYVDMVRFAGAKPVILETSEESDFLISPARLEAAITEHTRLVIINSPSNPAGACYAPEQLAELAEVIARHPQLTVLSDEIYDCFVYGGQETRSFAAIAPSLRDRTVLINGCSKRYAMTGLRIGWALGPKPLISAMGRAQGQTTSNPCAVSQRGALAALTGDQAPVAVMADAYDARRRFVVGRLNAIPGVSCFDPRGAFYVLPNLSAFVGRRLPDGSVIDDAYSIAAHLLHEHALVVVPGGAFGAKNHVRLSFATDIQTLGRGIDRMRAALLALK